MAPPIPCTLTARTGQGNAHQRVVAHLLTNLQQASVWSSHDDDDHTKIKKS